MGWLSKAKERTTIETAVFGTMLIHGEQGSKAIDYGGNTDEYYHQENAADYLCQSRYHQVEIKDIIGDIYRYDRAALVRLG